MRDRQDYEAHGRKNPLEPQQLRDHPYDFVSLPNEPASGDAVAQDRYHGERLTGTLHLVYVTVSPLHVGSGVFETAKECGLGNSTTPVRGIVRRQGRPILPGSGWKGAVRARYEAITRSRLVLADTRADEKEPKVPEVLRNRGSSARSYQVEIDDQRVRWTLRAQRTVESFSELRNLSPADALFGCMGYRGRVRPGDGVIEGRAATEPLRVAPLDSPVMHRLAKPGAAKNTGNGRIRISKVEGRKFYYDGEIVSSRQDDQKPGGRYEWIDQVPAGCTVTMDVFLDSVTPAEIGALLLSAGYGDGIGIVRFGGFKPVGLGKVELKTASVRVDRGRPGRSWKRGDAQPFDLGSAVAEARKGLVDVAALQELHEVTTRRRPQ